MLEIKVATAEDVPIILSFIKRLAGHVDLLDEVVACEQDLHDSLFNGDSNVEVLLGYVEGEPVAFVLFFTNYSTFLGRPGLYVEDLYIRSAYRGRGFGKAIFSHLAGLAAERNYGKIEWYTSEQNKAAVKFYHHIGAKPLEQKQIFRLKGAALEKLAGAK